jgi:hypothetical protein
MTNTSVDVLTSAPRKVRAGELVNLSFSVLRRNWLLFALAGVVPRLPWLVGATMGDALPIIAESYDSLQPIGFPVGPRYVRLRSATALYRAFQDMRGVRAYIGGRFEWGLTVSCRFSCC